MLKTFKKGGVHPHENKFSANSPIQPIDPPQKIFVPLSQSLGAPSKPVVKKGDEVKAGDILATGESFISSYLHSPVSGKIENIDDFIDVSGYRKPAIFIEVTGSEWKCKCEFE